MHGKRGRVGNPCFFFLQEYALRHCARENRRVAKHVPWRSEVGDSSPELSQESRASHRAFRMLARVGQRVLDSVAFSGYNKVTKRSFC